MFLIGSLKEDLLYRFSWLELLQGYNLSGSCNRIQKNTLTYIFIQDWLTSSAYKVWLIYSVITKKVRLIPWLTVGYK